MIEEIDLTHRVDAFAAKVRHYLVTMMGITLEEANDESCFRALSLALREEVMINWTATIHTRHKVMPRTLYYLCMEYLPGRLLANNICNMNSSDFLQRVVKKLGRDYKRILNVERDPALGNGGLGRLASCMLDGLATQQYPAIGYGLRYQYGIFEQEIWGGKQIERPENWLALDTPWEFRKDTNGVNVFYSGQAIPKKNGVGVEVYDLVGAEEVRALSHDIPIVGYRPSTDFSVLSLRLWTTKESPRNFALQRYNSGFLDQATENTCLTDVLYPNDDNELGKRVRLKQEYLLAAASVADILNHFCRQTQDMTLLPDKVRIHINDTHPAFVIAELMHILLEQHDFSWGAAFDVVKSCCNYTNHTILREALEEWNEGRIAQLLPRQHRIIQRLNEDFCRKVRAKFPQDEARVRRMSIIEEGQIKMAHLAISSSSKVNGVAQLHTDLLKKELFKDFYDLDAEQFVNVTNGVTPRLWLHCCNPRLAHCINRHIGTAWITDFKQIEKIASFASDPRFREEFIRVKRENKEAFAQFLRENNPIRDPFGKQIGQTEPFGSEALFDVQIKRIHEYKRQLMNALHAIILYHELKRDGAARQMKRMILIGGKAAPGYVRAKQIIQLICAIGRKVLSERQVADRLRVIYYENYNASRAEKIIPAADLSEQISCSGLEASGTGNMKLAMNGALSIATEDGASIEMHQQVTDVWWPFQFGALAEENALAVLNGEYNPWDIYKNHPHIAEAVDALKDHSLAETEEEHLAFTALYQSLLMPLGGERADKYFVLRDLVSYYQVQKKVESYYGNPHLWAEYAIHNVASMNRFSIDETVHSYAKNIWQIDPCPVDHHELERVRRQHTRLDP